MFRPAWIRPCSIGSLSEVCFRISRRCVSISTRSPRSTARSITLVATIGLAAARRQHVQRLAGRFELADRCHLVVPEGGHE